MGGCSVRASGAKVVALRLRCWQSDRTMNTLSMVPVYIRHHLSALDGGFRLATNIIWGHPSRRASFVPRRLLDMITTGNDKIWDGLSKTGVQTIERHKSNPPSPFTDPCY